MVEVTLKEKLLTAFLKVARKYGIVIGEKDLEKYKCYLCDRKDRKGLDEEWIEIKIPINQVWKAKLLYSGDIIIDNGNSTFLIKKEG